MESKASCLAELTKVVGDVMSEREAAQFFRDVQQMVDDAPAFEAGVRERLSAVQDAVNRKIAANEIYDMQAEAQAKATLLSVVSKADTIRRRANLPKMSLAEEEQYLAGKLNPDDLLAQGRKRIGVSGAMRDMMLDINSTVRGARSMTVSPLFSTLDKHGLYTQWGQSNLAEKALLSALDGVEAESEAVSAVSKALADADKLLKIELRKVGIPIADDVSTLYTARSVDQKILNDLGEDGFVELMQSVRLKTEYLPETARSNPTQFFKDTYNKLTREGSNGFDYTDISYLTSSSKVAAMGDRFSVLSSLPFADSESFVRYVQATTDMPVSKVLESRLDQAGRALGMMASFGPRPGKAIAAILNSVSDVMTQGEKAFYLASDVLGDTVHQFQADDGKFWALPTTDATNISVDKKTVVRDFKNLADDAFKTKYGVDKGKLKQFDTAAAARKYAQKKRSDFIKNTATLLESFSYKQPHPASFVAQVMGELSTPQNPVLASSAAAFRGVTSVGVLSWGTIAQLPDMAYQAQNLWSNYRVNPITTWANNLGNIWTPRQQKELLADWGIAVDSVLDNLRTAHDDMGHMPSVVDKVVNRSYKVNFMRPFDRMMRASSLELAMNSAIKAAQAGQLSSPAMRVFAKYGLTDPELIRTIFTDGAVRLPNGRQMLDRALVENIAPGELPKLYAAMQDIDVNAVAAPTDFDRAILTAGTRAGTFSGELMRFLGQFKSFPIMMYTRIAPRVGYDSGTAGILVTATTAAIFAYVGESIKRIAQGKEPFDPTDPNTIIRMYARAGAFGVADLMVDPSDPTANQVAARLIGPSLSSATKFAVAGVSAGYLPGAILAGDDKEIERQSKDIWRAVSSITPGTGPIPKIKLFGGQSLEEILLEEMMFGIPEALYMIDPTERARSERRQAKREEEIYGTLQLP